MEVVKKIDYDGLKSELYDRVEFILNAFTKGDRNEAKTGFTCSMMSEEEFNSFWPEKTEEQEKLRFTKYGRFKYRDHWFELRPVYRIDPSFCENLALENYELYHLKEGNYVKISDINMYKVMDLDPGAIANVEVPEFIVEIAEEHILK